MRWSPMGAHLLLQVRAELVDGRFGNTFARCYPNFARKNQIAQFSEYPTI